MRKAQYGRQDRICGTAHLIESGGRKIAIDWGGGFEGAGKTRVVIAPEGDFLRGMHVDLLVLTHAHLDHALYAPQFLGVHPETRALMSRATHAIASVLLTDAMKIAEKEARVGRERGDAVIPTSPFTRLELERFISGDQIEFVESGTWVMPWSGWNIGFYSAGHVTGAVSVFIDAAYDRPMFLTGDISSQNQLIIRGVMTPPESFLQGFFNQPDLVMVSEATNGGRDAVRSLEEERAALVAQVEEVREREGVALFTTFAVQRIPEMAAVLLRAGIVPYVDGMARETMAIEAPELFDRVHLVPRFEKWWEGEKFREEIAKTPGNVILASSGTLEGGTAVSYARHILPGRENGVFFVGHIFNESVAEKLLKVERGNTIRLPDLRKEEGVIVNVRSDVYRFDFSAHDYRSALAERVRRVNPEALIIHHVGESEGVDGFTSLATKIREEMGDGASPEIIREDHLSEIEKRGVS